MSTINRSAVTGRFVSAEEAAADPERHVAEAVPDPLRVERMNPIFEKLHLGDGRVVHRFAAADGPDADPHDHPWPFFSTIIAGGYVEEVFSLDHPLDPPQVIERRPGDTFRNEAGTIHRIVRLTAPECWTVIRPGAAERTPGFYRFQGGGVLYREWFTPDFRVLPPLG